MKKNILITGATGLVGSHLVIDLLETNRYEIHCAIRSEKSLEKFHKVCNEKGVDYSSVSFHIVEVESYIQIFELLREVKPKVIYQCAGEVDLTNGDEENLIRNNVGLVNSIGEAALRYSRDLDPEIILLHISSIAALGEVAQGEYVTEQTQVSNLAAMSPYGKSKFLSENAVWRYSKMGLKVIVVNPSVIIGRSGGGGGLNAVYRLLSKGIPFYTGAKMGFIGVKDVARAMRILSENPNEKIIGQRFILNSHNLEYKDFIGLFNRHFGHRAPWIRVPKWLLWVGLWTMGMWCKLFGREPMMTISVIGFMTDRVLYDGTKICGALQEFRYSEELEIF